jgi:MFS transporter, ACS family, D-galactonate transporter
MKSDSPTSLQPYSMDLDAPAVSNSRRWTIVGLLFTASMINYVDRATVSFALPLISKELSLGPMTKGVLLSAFFWSYALMQIPIGYLADRVNLRWLYAGAFTLWSVAQGLTGFAGGLTALVLLRALLGIGESIYLPGGSKIVSLLFPPKDRGLPSGLFDMGTRTGLVLDGILIPWLLVHYGWRRMFFIVGFSAMLWLIPWLIIYPRKLQSREPIVPPGPSPAARPRQKPRVMTINRDLWGLCLGFFCFDYYWYLLLTWLPDYLVSVRGLTILTAGLSASVPYFVFGSCQPLGGWMGDRMVRRGWNETRARKLIVTAAFCTGLFVIPAAWAENTGTAVALIILGSFVGLATANILVILQGCAPRGEVGVWTGAENFAGNLAGVLAPLVTGFLISVTGSYRPAFALGALILLAGILSYWLIVGEMRPQTGNPAGIER